MSALAAARIPTLSSERERLLLLTPAAVQFSHIVDFMVMMPLGPFLMQGKAIDTIAGPLDDTVSEGWKIQRPDDGTGGRWAQYSKSSGSHTLNARREMRRRATGWTPNGLPVVWLVSL